MNTDFERMNYEDSKLTRPVVTEVEKRKLLIHFLDSLRAYEHESHNLIGHDERESSEFVDIYLKELLNQ